MRKSVKSRAEEQFTASKKKADQILKNKDKTWQEIGEKTARLKALRLAKEASDIRQPCTTGLSDCVIELPGKTIRPVDVFF